MHPTINDPEEIIRTAPAVLVDFFAEWCEPCKWLDPALLDLEKIFSGKLQVMKTDVDEHKMFSEKSRVMSVPTLIFYKNGMEQWRYQGVPDKSFLIKIIENNL